MYGQNWETIYRIAFLYVQREKERDMERDRPRLFRFVENCQREHDCNYECTGTSLKLIQRPQQLARNSACDNASLCIQFAYFQRNLMLIGNNDRKKGKSAT